MLHHLIRSQLKKNAAMLMDEARRAEGFMKLLMKQRNNGDKWTKEEKLLLKKYLQRLAAYVPVLMVFMLPFGTVLIPVLAEMLDRRKMSRNGSQS